MKLHPHATANLAITAIADKTLSIDQIVHDGSVIVHAKIGVAAWAVKQLTDITDSDVERWILTKPELVVLGAGTKHGFLAPALAVKLVRAGVGLECMATPAAARTYNVLLDEGRDVLGAFIN